jgi:hypothetical protein
MEPMLLTARPKTIGHQIQLPLLLLLLLPLQENILIVAAVPVAGEDGICCPRTRQLQQQLSEPLTAQTLPLKPHQTLPHFSLLHPAPQHVAQRAAAAPHKRRQQPWTVPNAPASCLLLQTTSLDAHQ